MWHWVEFLSLSLGLFVCYIGHTEVWAKEGSLLVSPLSGLGCITDFLLQSPQGEANGSQREKEKGKGRKRREVIELERRGQQDNKEESRQKDPETAEKGGEEREMGTEGQG